MILIGLTGGIGSGKSTVAAIFATLGIPIYNSDDHAKSLMQDDASLRSRITELLGARAYTKDEMLDKAWIAQQVFSDNAKLQQLNNIVHPAVFTDLINWSAQPKQAMAPYLIQESAILFEEDLTSRFNGVILVVADVEERIRRVMNRDNTSREHVLKRIENQWDDDRKIPNSEYVIYNDSKSSLLTQVMDIDKMIRMQFIGE